MTILLIGLDHRLQHFGGELDLVPVLFLRLSGRKGQYDLLFKIARSGHSERNACRNLHRLINRNGLLYPVPISAKLITVARRKPTYSVEQLWWPILKMSDWVKVLLARTPKILLAGHDLKDFGWKNTLRQFWLDYEEVNGSHIVYQSGFPPEFNIPYFLHGDEGRTHRSRSFMVESFQPVISHKGPMKTNESGYLVYLLVCPLSYDE